jgi:homoaconitase/3-isopropylmalate dehydratase large subunit
VKVGKPFMIKVDVIGSHEVTLPRDLVKDEEAMKKIAKNILDHKFNNLVLIHDHDLKRNPQSALNHWYLRKFYEKLKESLIKLGANIEVKDIPEKNKEEIYVNGRKAFCYCKFGSGICHRRILEDALVKPMETLIFPDSHTCTAGALGAYAVGVGTTDVRYGFLYGIYWDIYYGSDLIRVEGSLPKGVTTKDIALKVEELYKDGGEKNKVLVK